MTHQSEADSLEERLRNCEKVLQYEFRDRELLQRCLTHASVAKTRLESNERLEFLGDSILGMFVCEDLFTRFPDDPEGELTRLKSVLVSGNTCAEISRKLGLERFLLLGKGLSTHPTVPDSIVAAVLESLIAGVYLDGGMQPAQQFVSRLFAPQIEQVVDAEHGRNFKSLLQQLSQKSFGETPVYRLLDEKGPDHSKCFKVSAVIGANTYSAAWGPNKKEAEQRAAQNALFELQGDELPHVSD